MKFKHVSDDISKIDGSHNWRSEHFALFAGMRYLSTEARKDIVVSVWSPAHPTHLAKFTIYPYFILPSKIDDLLLPLAFHIMQELLPIPDVPDSKDRIEKILEKLAAIYGKRLGGRLSKSFSCCFVNVSEVRRNLKALREEKLCQTSPSSISSSEISTSIPE